jgi:hypothetical protein
MGFHSEIFLCTQFSGIFFLRPGNFGIFQRFRIFGSFCICPDFESNVFIEEDGQAAHRLFRQGLPGVSRDSRIPPGFSIGQYNVQ